MDIRIIKLLLVIILSGCRPSHIEWQKEEYKVIVKHSDSLSLAQDSLYFMSFLDYIHSSFIFIANKSSIFQRNPEFISVCMSHSIVDSAYCFPLKKDRYGNSPFFNSISILDSTIFIDNSNEKKIQSFELGSSTIKNIEYDPYDQIGLLLKVFKDDKELLYLQSLTGGKNVKEFNPVFTLDNGKLENWLPSLIVPRIEYNDVRFFKDYLLDVDKSEMVIIPQFNDQIICVNLETKSKMKYDLPDDLKFALPLESLGKLQSFIIDLKYEDEELLLLTQEIENKTKTYYLNSLHLKNGKMKRLLLSDFSSFQKFPIALSKRGIVSFDIKNNILDFYRILNED